MIGHLDKSIFPSRLVQVSWCYTQFQHGMLTHFLGVDLLELRPAFRRDFRFLINANERIVINSLLYSRYCLNIHNLYTLVHIYQKNKIAQQKPQE